MHAYISTLSARKPFRWWRVWALAFCCLSASPALAQTPQWAWAQTLYTDVQALSSIDQVSEMQSDAAGNVYAVGSFTDDAHFGPHTLIGAGGLDIFVAKFSPSGQCLWAIRGGGVLGDGAPQISLDSRGDLYVAVGSISDFETDCGVIPAPNSLHTAALLWKISANGTCQWVRLLAHALAPPQTSGNIRIQSMDLDANDGPVCILASNGPVRIGTTDYAVLGLYTWAVRCDPGGGCDGSKISKTVTRSV